MELPIQYITVKDTNYIIRKYKVNDVYMWSLESYKGIISGFDACYKAKNFLIDLHPYCIYCHTHLNNYVEDKYMDWVSCKEIETKMCCPFCGAWNDELILKDKQEMSKDDPRIKVYKNKTYVKDKLYFQLTCTDYYKI